MNKALLLDTCALLWLVNGEPLSVGARESIRWAAAAQLLFLSPISAWEVATLSRKNRIVLNKDTEDWFEDASRVPGMAVLDLTWRILLKSVFLPGDPPNDPADRILLSTARRNSLCLMTRDRKLLDYAQAGHVDAMAC